MIQSGVLIHNRFRIIGQVDQGRFGMIHSAHDNRTDSIVIMKTLKSGEEADLQKEYNFLVRLAPYTYVPTPVEFGRIPQFPYFVMSQEGKSLQDMATIFSAGFDERTVSLLLYHSLMAMHSVHQLGVCHADITLMNLCLPLTPLKGRVLLLDFGDAVEYNEIARHNDISKILMSFQLVSNAHLLLTEVRHYHNQDIPSSTEDVLGMIRNSVNFNENDCFQWETESSRNN